MSAASIAPSPPGVGAAVATADPTKYTPPTVAKPWPPPKAFARVVDCLVTEAGRAPMGGFSHPKAIAIVAAAGFLLSLLVALPDHVSRIELDVTEWVNDAPQWVADALYPVMQLGTLLAPFLVAALILVLRRDWLLAVATVIVGLVAWYAAKGVKELVQRGRPLQYLPSINVREGSGTGLGFVSGHSAVAAASAVMLMAALPRRWRPIAIVAAALVGVARIVFGLHLPTDVVGGWSLGVSIALAGLWVVDLVTPARATSTPR